MKKIRLIIALCIIFCLILISLEYFKEGMFLMNYQSDTQDTLPCPIKCNSNSQRINKKLPIYLFFTGLEGAGHHLFDSLANLIEQKYPFFNIFRVPFKIDWHLINEEDGYYLSKCDFYHHLLE